MSNDKSATKNIKKKRNSWIVTIVCVGVFIYSIYELSSIFMVYYHNHQVLTEVQQVYKEVASDEKETPKNELEDIVSRKIRPQFLDLKEINEDIVGWVSIEDTKINYPILQAEDNDYYLTKNYEKEESIAGSIFMDYRNDVESYNPNMVVYGHRMRDNSMFNSLKNFLKEDFFYNHKTIQFDTMYESYTAEVFAAYSTTTDFDYIQTDFDNAIDFWVLTEKMRQKSKFQSDVSLNMEDQIITLSTCDYTLDPDQGRLVVHAKLVKR